MIHRTGLAGFVSAKRERQGPFHCAKDAARNNYHVKNGEQNEMLEQGCAGPGGTIPDRSGTAIVLSWRPTIHAMADALPAGCRSGRSSHKRLCAPFRTSNGHWENKVCPVEDVEGLCLYPCSCLFYTGPTILDTIVLLSSLMQIGEQRLLEYLPAWRLRRQRSTSPFGAAIPKRAVPQSIDEPANIDIRSDIEPIPHDLYIPQSTR